MIFEPALPSFWDRSFSASLAGVSSLLSVFCSFQLRFRADLSVSWLLALLRLSEHRDRF